MTIESADEFVRLRLSDDPAEYHRAAHDDAPAAVWDEVISTHPDMKPWVVHNKNVPLELLRRLAGDPEVAVRCAVASKRKLDRELFVQLGGDAQPEVRHRIACNAKAPAEVLQALAEDACELVAEAARQRLPEALCRWLVGVSMYGPRAEAEAACSIGLAHADLSVRQVALTAVGHTARVNRAISDDLLRQAIAALDDPDLRDRATNALDDIAMFVFDDPGGWTAIPGAPER